MSTIMSVLPKVRLPRGHGGLAWLLLPLHPPAWRRLAIGQSYRYSRYLRYMRYMRYGTLRLDSRYRYVRCIRCIRCIYVTYVTCVTAPCGWAVVPS